MSAALPPLPLTRLSRAALENLMAKQLETGKPLEEVYLDMLENAASRPRPKRKPSETAG